MRINRSRLAMTAGILAATFGASSMPTYADDTQWSGFVEQVTHYRDEVGLSKARSGFQLEGLKFIGDVGPFTDVSTNTIIRVSYDHVYDMNSDQFGRNAGSTLDNPAMVNSNGLLYAGLGLQPNADGNFAVPINGPGIGPAGGLSVGSFAVINILGPQVDALSGGDGTGSAFPYGLVLGANTFVDSYANNPNIGLVALGDYLHPHGNGVSFGVPVRPCDIDSRGCLPGFMDADLKELKMPEIYGGRLDWLREFYVDATLEMSDDDQVSFRLGKQQVIWGRTDLFRVLDIINPVDYSRNNIYDELEDIRIPMWMLKTDFRFGPTGGFDDLNAQIVWNFDKFRPNSLGQAGTPYEILGAGSFFRGMKNLWDNGGTVANFAPLDLTGATMHVDASGNPVGPALLATNFGPGVIGIRDVHLPEWSLSNTQLGLKLEGVSGDFTWSVNAMTYRSQLPSLRGYEVEAINPFVGTTGPVGVAPQTYTHLIAFDVHFPRINMLGGSFDYYSQDIDTVFRVEAAYSQGEEFANTMRKELYSENDVFRFVLGMDKNVFIRSINESRAFLLSGQIFGQHIVDHELEMSTLGGMGVPGFGEVGMPDWETNFIGTFLIKGWWMNDRVSPQFIIAHDFKAGATVIEPSVDFLLSDKWQVIVKANIKSGGSEEMFNDCRTCNPFGPFTTGIPPMPEHGNGTVSGPAGIYGFEPLGRFRSGPIGMAEKEDEIQLTVRYRF